MVGIIAGTPMGSIEITRWDLGIPKSFLMRSVLAPFFSCYSDLRTFLCQSDVRIPKFEVLISVVDEYQYFLSLQAHSRNQMRKRARVSIKLTLTTLRDSRSALTSNEVKIIDRHNYAQSGIACLRRLCSGKHPLRNDDSSRLYARQLSILILSME